MELDPVLDVRNISNRVEQKEENLSPRVNETDNNEEVSDIADKADISGGLSNSLGPAKTTLIRDGKAINIEGGLDFSNAVFDEEMGKRCIVKQEEIETVERNPVLECKHR